MPIKIPLNLPGRSILEQENISFILEDRALKQDIRPLQIAILNLMPDKISTERQLLRALAATPLQIELTLLRPGSHQSRNTSKEHLEAFYRTFEDVKHRKFDGLIITGAPIEHVPYEEVSYWRELTDILHWADKHVYSTMFLCWAAFAGLYHYNQIPKRLIPQKLSGIYRHTLASPFAPLVYGFDERFDVPVSRSTEVLEEDLRSSPDLKVLAQSEESGIFLIEDSGNRRFYVLNHLEYEVDTLKREYERDLTAGLRPHLPHNYFPDNDPALPPRMTWRSHRTLLFSNWINIVYQGTPYQMDQIGGFSL